MIKRIALGTIAALFVVGISAVAQMWPNFPIVGGASYSCGSVNAVSTCTVAAGPAMTGLETIPADTNATGGVSPQTVKISVASLNSGVLTYNAPVTAATITLTSVTRQLILEPLATIAALTITMPVATGLINGQRLGICTTQIVTTLTLTAGSGTTISNGPTALLVPVATGAASCVDFIYRSANTTWYRTQ